LSGITHAALVSERSGCRRRVLRPCPWLRLAGTSAAATREAGAALVQVSGVGPDAGSPQRCIRARGQGEQAVRAAHPGAVLVRPTVGSRRRGAWSNRLCGCCGARGSFRCSGAARHGFSRFTAVTWQGPSWNSSAAGIALRPLPVPFPLWHAVALLAERLPGAPLTRDQVALMRDDKIAADGLATLGIAPQALDTALQGLPASACG